MITKNVLEIEEEIRLHEPIEWRSKKNFDEFVRSNTFEKDISIIGYITPRTIEKWGLDMNGYIKTNNVYVGVRKNKRLCYLQGLGIPKPIDYSFYTRFNGL